MSGETLENQLLYFYFVVQSTFEIKHKTMKAQNRFYRAIFAVAIATVAVLMIPLVAMQFTSEVDWNPADFIIMGSLFFSIGFSYVLLTRRTANAIYRIAAALGLGTTFLMIWANLAVGLIGSGPNAGNLMYLWVVAVVVIGTISSRFSARGMERTMFASAGALGLHVAVALLAGMHQYPGSSVAEIIGVNGFFAVLFILSGAMFRYVALNQAQAGPTSA